MTSACFPPLFMSKEEFGVHVPGCGWVSIHGGRACCLPARGLVLAWSSLQERTHVVISSLRTGGCGWKCLVWRYPGRGDEGRNSGEERALGLRLVSCFRDRC